MHVEANRAAWIEIDLNCIDYNIKEIINKVGDASKIMGVIKSDAYGHGAVKIAKLLSDNGIHSFAVATLPEAMELRKAGFTSEELVPFCLAPDSLTETIVEYDLTPLVCSLENAHLISQIASEKGKTISGYIAVDTGMGRIGYNPDSSDALDEILQMSKLENFKIKGLFSHMSTADETDKKETYLQLERYKKVIDALEKANIDIQFKHVSNTAAIIDLKELGFNMVRLGIGLYGHYPSDEVSKEVELKPAMKLKTIITNIKTVAPGTKVSYGYTYEFKEASTLATLAIGYADGFDRTQNNPKVMINGVLCDVVGRICMDQCMVKIPEGLNVNIEDEVLIMGAEVGVTAEDLASRRGTINYEVLCSVSRRVTRDYNLGDKTYSKCYLY